MDVVGILVAEPFNFCRNWLDKLSSPTDKGFNELKAIEHLCTHGLSRTPEVLQSDLTNFLTLTNVNNDNVGDYLKLRLDLKNTSQLEESIRLGNTHGKYIVTLKKFNRDGQKGEIVFGFPIYPRALEQLKIKSFHETGMPEYNPSNLVTKLNGLLGGDFYRFNESHQLCAYCLLNLLDDLKKIQMYQMELDKGGMEARDFSEIWGDFGSMVTLSRGRSAPPVIAGGSSKSKRTKKRRTNRRTKRRYKKKSNKRKPKNKSFKKSIHKRIRKTKKYRKTRR